MPTLGLVLAFGLWIVAQFLDIRLFGNYIVNLPAQSACAVAVLLGGARFAFRDAARDMPRDGFAGEARQYRRGGRREVLSRGTHSGSRCILRDRRGETYRVWLRYELFRGRLSESGLLASEANLIDYIASRSNTKPHLAYVKALQSDTAGEIFIPDEPGI